MIVVIVVIVVVDADAAIAAAIVSSIFVDAAEAGDAIVRAAAEHGVGGCHACEF